MPSRRKSPTLFESIRDNAPVMAMGGSLLATAVLILNQLATKDYVKEQDAIMLGSAHAYSDANRAANLIEIKEVGAEVKATSVKLDTVVDMLRDRKNK